MAPRPIRTWTDGATGSLGPVTVNFIDAAEAAAEVAVDKRKKRRRNAHLVAEAARAIREPVIREAAGELIASGTVQSWSDAYRTAHNDYIQADLAAEARRKLPNATEEGIRRRVVKELDIRDAVRHRKEAVSDRLVHGYRWAGGGDPATGRERSAFTYQGLRSDEHPLLKLFASCLPKARPASRDVDETELKQSLMTGSKEFTKATGSKLLGLDEVYVEGQKSVRGFIRVDCDHEFETWDALRLALIDAFESIDLLPHIVVGDERADGRIINPHFIWLLPEKSRIRFDSKALPGPQRLYHAIARALTAACIPVGGDVGGLSNPLRVKNPLCPHWSVAVLNQRDPMCLSDLMVHLEPWMSANEATMAQRQVAVHGAAVGIDECQSNSFFKEATAAAWALAREWIAVDDKRGALTGDDLAQAFIDALEHDARHAMVNVPPRRAMGMLKSVCRWAARHFDPTKRRRTVNPGALQGQLGGLSLTERQAAGGKHAAGVRRDASLDAIQAAIDAMMSQGEEITKAAVARRAGIAYKTVQRRWDAVAASRLEAFSPSALLRRTDSLRKIASDLQAAHQKLTATLLESETAKSESPTTVLLTSLQLSPARDLPHNDDEEVDEIDDATVLAEHDAWVASQECGISDCDNRPWADDPWADAA